MLVVGDSAGQTKVTSGGGIYFGLKCAKIAAKIATQCLEKDTLRNKHLKQYEFMWKKAIGRELKTTLFIRKLVNRLSDKELDLIFQTLSNDKIKSIIEKHGDTAYQSRLLRPLLPEFIHLSFKEKTHLFLIAKLFFRSLTSMLQ